MRFLPRLRGHGRGFTLIELMIAVAIVGILVKLAYPAYTQSVMKSRRADAKNALVDLASREERFMSTQNAYTSSTTGLGYQAGTSFPLPVLTGSTAYYNLSVTVPVPAAGVAPTFTATATPVAGTSQAADSCGTYTLTSAGVQSVSGTSSVGDCW